MLQRGFPAIACLLRPNQAFTDLRATISWYFCPSRFTLQATLRKSLLLFKCVYPAHIIEWVWSETSVAGVQWYVEGDGQLPWLQPPGSEIPNTIVTLSLSMCACLEYRVSWVQIPPGAAIFPCVGLGFTLPLLYDRFTSINQLQFMEFGFNLIITYTRRSLHNVPPLVLNYICTVCVGWAWDPNLLLRKGSRQLPNCIIEHNHSWAQLQHTTCIGALAQCLWSQITSHIMGVRCHESHPHVMW